MDLSTLRSGDKLPGLIIRGVFRQGPLLVYEIWDTATNTETTLNAAQLQSRLQSTRAQSNTPSAP